MQSLNMPVYGLKINSAIMSLFKDPKIQQLAQQIGVRIPNYTLSSFVQGKSSNIRKLTAIARALPDCTASDKAAVDRLDAFLDDFENLKGADVSSPEGWQQIVDRHAA